MNGCLRPACTHDLYLTGPRQYGWYFDLDRAVVALRPLYDAEWRKRGFQRSP